MASSDAQICPGCAETIEATARECPLCGELLAFGKADRHQPIEFESRLMRPRSPVRTFAIVFALSAAPMGIMWAWLFALMQGQPFGRILPFGLGFGVTVGLFLGIQMAYLLTQVVRVVRFTDRIEFSRNLDAVIAKMRYIEAVKENEAVIYKPRRRSGAGVAIAVQIDARQATLVGPRMIMSGLLKLLGKTDCRFKVE